MRAARTRAAAQPAVFCCSKTTSSAVAPSAWAWMRSAASSSVNRNSRSRNVDASPRNSNSRAGNGRSYRLAINNRTDCGASVSTRLSAENVPAGNTWASSTTTSPGKRGASAAVNRVRNSSNASVSCPGTHNTSPPAARRRADQSDNNTVFPVPTGATTIVSGNRTPRSSATCNRSRTTKDDGVRGARPAANTSRASRARSRDASVTPRPSRAASRGVGLSRCCLTPPPLQPA